MSALDKPKVIYINPGDMVEVRFISDDLDPKTAAAWNAQLRPEKLLLRLWSHDVAAADPRVNFSYRFSDRERQ